MAQKKAGMLNPIGSIYDVVDIKRLNSISQKIGTDVKKLGRELGLTDENVENIVQDNNVYGAEETAYKVLYAWKQTNGHKATWKMLATHVSAIQRKDLAEQIEEWFADGNNSLPIPVPEHTLLSSHDEGSLRLNRIQERLKDEYEGLRLQGLPWMQEIDVTLSDCYVALSMIQQSDKGQDLQQETVQLTEIFTPLGMGGKPKRLLVEGGPGYGKTTFGSKLCYDYSTAESYISQFDLVLLLPLRHFTGDLKLLMKKASRACKENLDDLYKIVKDENVSTLLVLDGYDEIPKQYVQALLPLIQGNYFSHVTIIVTSRPGHFTPQAGSHNSFPITSDVSISEKLFYSRFKIMGINKTLIPHFVSNFTGHDQVISDIAVEKLKVMVHNKVVTDSFLECPLFLLMVILLLTDTNDVTIQNFQTRTRLYQEITTFVIKRYAVKSGSKYADSIDLFSFDIDRKCIYTDLMIQFGQFALETIMKDRLSFSTVDILDSQTGSRDERIIDLGLLTKSASVKGSRKNVFYEPVHSSLLEFSAAYCLRVDFKNKPRSEWKEKIRMVRPKSGTASSSLLFPFLNGLMGKDAHILYNALKPYAAEYSLDFRSLELSLSEVQMTEDLLSSIRPLLPIHLILQRTDTEFFSTHLSKILHLALKDARMKQLELFTSSAICFHEDVKVNKLILCVEDTVVPFIKNRSIILECKDLYCYFEGANPSDTSWTDFLSLIGCIKFGRISLFFRRACSFLLPLFCSEVLSGCLQDVNICFVQLGYGMKYICRLMEITDLIKRNKLKLRGMWLELLPSDDSESSFSSCMEDCQGCCSLMQKCIDDIVTCVSKSAPMLYFVLRDRQQTNLSVDLARLCDYGQKSWKWMRIDYIKIKCGQEIQNQNLKLQQFEAYNSELEQPVFTLLQSCQITALNCNYPFTGNNSVSCLHNEHVTEVRVELNESIFRYQFFAQLSQLPKLQILAFQISTFDCDPDSAENWLLKSSTCSFNLKGIEIRTVEKNPELVKGLVNAIFKLLKGTPGSVDAGKPSDADGGRSRKLKLHFLMLSTDLQPDADVSSYESKCFLPFMAVVPILKEYLKTHLPQLDIVTFSNRRFQCMSNLKPGLPSICDLFSVADGFTVKHDMLGMKKDDPVWSRHYRNFYPIAYHRFSISHAQVDNGLGIFIFNSVTWNMIILAALGVSVAWVFLHQIKPILE